MINLTKDNRSVSLDKVPSIGVVTSWPAVTDYDLGAEILYKDGSIESLATFGAKGTSAKTVSKNGTIVLRGDAGRGVGYSEEVMSVEWDDEIDMVAPWVYSAQSNGVGSFRKHRVSTTITVGDNVVTINADDASSNSTVYTLVPGLLRFSGTSVLIEFLERYSEPGSESRPKFVKAGLFGGGRLLSMSGPRNQYK